MTYEALGPDLYSGTAGSCPVPGRVVFGNWSASRYAGPLWARSGRRCRGWIRSRRSRGWACLAAGSESPSPPCAWGYWRTNRCCCEQARRSSAEGCGGKLRPQRVRPDGRKGRRDYRPHRAEPDPGGLLPDGFRGSSGRRACWKPPPKPAQDIPGKRGACGIVTISQDFRTGPRVPGLPFWNCFRRRERRGTVMRLHSLTGTSAIGSLRNAATGPISAKIRTRRLEGEAPQEVLDILVPRRAGDWAIATARVRDSGGWRV